MQIISFDPVHLDGVEVSGQSANVFKLLKSKASELRYAGPCFTGIYKGEIVGCAGLAEMWPGVAKAWTVIAKGFPKIKVHRAVKNGLGTLIEACGYHRVEADVKSDFLAGRLWLERLGFECEGKMKKYGPDKEDFMRYARVK